MKINIITLGCSKNNVDSEVLAASLQRKGHTVWHNSTKEHGIDTVIINTCAFIQDAKQQAIDEILLQAERKKHGLIKKLYVVGCLAQRYEDDLRASVPEIDGVYPFVRLNELIGDEDFDLLGSSDRILSTPPYYAYLKISEGCDRQCSYCAIPLIRGPHRSVPMETLVYEAEDLAAPGVRELVIIAQDTTYYGLDLYKKRSLAELLRRLSAVEGIEWLRIHYSYPADFPEDVLDEMANNPKVCRYMDIPLQHIADPVLDKMHRHVDGAWTRELIRRMREKVPGVVLRTTMIVGHPGETPYAFRQLLDFVEEARFERLGAFAYSEEEGTYGAGHFSDTVTPRTKKMRLSRLMELQRGISLAYNLSRVGTEVRVLADDFVDGIFVCRSEFESPEVDGEILVKYEPDRFGGVEPYSLVGSFFRVKVVSADEYDLTAELVEL